MSHRAKTKAKPTRKRAAKPAAKPAKGAKKPAEKPAATEAAAKIPDNLSLPSVIRAVDAIFKGILDNHREFRGEQRALVEKLAIARGADYAISGTFLVIALNGVTLPYGTDLTRNKVKVELTIGDKPVPVEASRIKIKESGEYVDRNY